MAKRIYPDPCLSKQLYFKWNSKNYENPRTHYQDTYTIYTKIYFILEKYLFERHNTCR